MNDFGEKLALPPAGKYVVAVSGGVDSVVLLHVLVQVPGLRLVVAHANHGMRADSAADTRFVAALAAGYGLPFCGEELKLGKGASEDKARQARYTFLHKVCEETGAAAIITAHHASDVLETALLNLQRGTGWRGLASLRSTTQLQRPFLGIFKKAIYHYVLAHKLEWVEDASNHTNVYARNRLRHQLLPRLSDAAKAHLLQLVTEQVQLREQIDTALTELLEHLRQNNGLPQHIFMQLTPSLASELLRTFYARHGLSQTRPQRARAATFIRTAHRRQRFSLDSRHFLAITSDKLVVVTSKS